MLIKPRGIMGWSVQSLRLCELPPPSQASDRNLTQSACTLLDLTVMYIDACDEWKKKKGTQNTHREKGCTLTTTSYKVSSSTSSWLYEGRFAAYRARTPCITQSLCHSVSKTHHGIDWHDTPSPTGMINISIKNIMFSLTTLESTTVHTQDFHTLRGKLFCCLV